MNNIELQRLLKGYHVKIRSADEVRVEKGRFIIPNTDTKDGPGKHWVTFYFADRTHDDVFDSLGKTPEYYDVGFETLLQNPYWMNCSRLQDFGSDTYGLYCMYYVMCRYAGMTMKDLVHPFNVRELNINDNNN